MKTAVGEDSPQYGVSVSHHRAAARALDAAGASLGTAAPPADGQGHTARGAAAAEGFRPPSAARGAERLARVRGRGPSGSEGHAPLVRARPGVSPRATGKSPGIPARAVFSV